MAKEGAVALIASQFLDLQKPEKVLTKAVGILALLSEAAENKDLFPDSDAICAMVPLFESPVKEIQDGVITTFANLADHGTYLSPLYQYYPCMPTLNHLVYYQ